MALETLYTYEIPYHKIILNTMYGVSAWGSIFAVILSCDIMAAGTQEYSYRGVCVTVVLYLVYFASLQYLVSLYYCTVGLSDLS